MKKSRLSKSPDISVLSHEYSSSLREAAANAIKQAQKLSMSDSSDSESDFESHEDGESAHSSQCLSDGEDEDGFSKVGKDEVLRDVVEERNDKEEYNVVDEDIPLFIFHAMESSVTSTIPQEFVNLFTSRDDLFWILQDDLLVKWCVEKKCSDSPISTFPSLVAQNLYTLLYSSDEEVLSQKASDTMVSLYKQCGAEESVLWLPNHINFMHALAYLSQKGPLVTNQRVSRIAPWCRVVNVFFQTLRSVTLRKREFSSTLSFHDLALLWRNLMTMSSQPHVVDKDDVVEGLLQAAQSVLRAAFSIAWQQSYTVEVTSSSARVCSTANKNGARHHTRQELAVELHSTMKWMNRKVAVPSKKGKNPLARIPKGLAQSLVKQKQDLFDHVALLSVYENSDIALYLSPLNTQQMVLQQNRIFHSCILAVQIGYTEIYLRHLFGAKHDTTKTAAENKFCQFMTEGKNFRRSVEVYQPYNEVVITAPSGNILCLLESVLSTSSNQAMILSCSMHYLQESSYVLISLSTALKGDRERAKVVKDIVKEEINTSAVEGERNKFSFEDNVDMIYELFKHVNMLFNIVLETAFSQGSDFTFEASSLGSKRLLDTVEKHPLQRSAKGKRATLNDGSCARLSPSPSTDTATACEEVITVEGTCSNFISVVNEFKPILRKRMGSMGSTIEISHIIRSINDKWDFAKEYNFK